MNKEKKTEILLVTGIFPPDIGGPATFARFFLDESEKYGIVADLLTFTDDAEGVYKIDTVKISRKGNIFLRYLRVFLAAWRLSKNKDVIYSLDVSSVGLPCLLVKMLRPKIKLFFRVGGDRHWEQAIEDGRFRDTLESYYRQRNFNSKERISYFLMKRAFRRADEIIFNAQIIADIFARHYEITEKKVHIIRNFKDELILPRMRQEADEEILLFFGGRLVAFKNILGFLKIFINIDFSEFGKDVVFQINGDGPEHDKIAEFIARNNLHGRVRLLPKVSRTEMLDLINRCNVFALPSLTEVNANTVSEVLQLGQPILLTKFSESFYIGEKNSNIFYINPFDDNDIEVQLKKAIAYSLLDKLKRENITSRASWSRDEIMRQHYALF